MGWAVEHGESTDGHQAQKFTEENFMQLEQKTQNCFKISYPSKT